MHFQAIDNDNATLNAKQQEAYDTIVERMSNNKGVHMILTGPAGTGKTFLCNQLAQALSPAMCAMTHKAAEVMFKATGKDVATFASLMKHRKHNNYDTGQSEFGSISMEPPSLKKDTVFIDECSMLSEQHLNEARIRLAPYNVLFIGDEFQLPPVGENYAQAFVQELPKFRLTEPVRFRADSGIAALATTVRDALERHSESIDSVADIMRDFVDVEHISEYEALERMKEEFAQVTNDVNRLRMLSYTNARVDLFNYYIKQAVTGVSEIAAKDVVFSNDTYTEVIDGETKIVLRNNAALLVSNVDEGEKLGQPVWWINGLPQPKSKQAVKRQCDEYAKLAKAGGKGSDAWKVNWAKFFELKEAFVDLRPAYAQTVHKSQGSSYGTVYFDTTQLDASSVIGKRLLYTGITRAKKKLVFFKAGA